jgi:EmrB/QacA subfamily drug resistance transporter
LVATERRRNALILAASMLGSGAVFLEGTVVNVALPAIGRDFSLGLDGLQWVVNAYLLTLGSLILLGGALGDRYQRGRICRVGAAGFAITSALCALAPGPATLAALRFVQGIAGALLVPNSLALIEDTFSGEERGAAIGKWAAGSAAWTALGPLVGGGIVSAASWRWVFALVVPFAVGAALLLPAASPGRSPARTTARIDYLGAILITAGLGTLVGALIAGPERGFGDPLVLAGLIAGALLLAAFVMVEWRTRDPLLPLDVFRSMQFTGANLFTFLVYGALGVVLFLLILVLQNVAGYSALAAGSALLPVNALLVFGSPYVGRLAERTGPRLPMSLGALTAGVGLSLLTRVGAGASYVSDVLPGIVVFGLGLTALVAPLTSAVLISLGKTRAGLASGVNNAVARLAGLIATAAIPLAAGMGGLEQVSGQSLADGFRRAMWICAALCAVGALGSWWTIDRGRNEK